ncbi:MAG: tripartite tricarboxylate transporter TctB family protein [Rhodospirillales bacterium]
MSSEPGGGAVANSKAAFWTGDRVAGLALIAAAAAVAAGTRGLPLGSLGHPGPGYTPVLYAAILFALGLAVALGRGGVPLGAMRWGELGHALAILGSGAFAALMLDRLGYRLTMLVVAAFLVGAVERRPALPTALIALGLSFGTHFVFWTLLRVPLPAGPFGL